MKRISEFMRPDQQMIATIHGPLYYVKEGADRGIDYAYNTARDKAEQAIVRRCATDAEFGKMCAAMTFEEWEAYLDEHCGKRPGRGKWYNRYNKTRQKHGGARSQEIPDGYLTVEQAAKNCGVCRHTIRNAIQHGVMRGHTRIVMQSVKIGKHVLTTQEWIEDYQTMRNTGKDAK